MIRCCDVMAELGVSVFEGEQLRVLTSGVRQITRTAGAMIIPTSKCGGSEDRRAKCRENRVKQKRLVEHVEPGLDERGWTRGESKKAQKAERRVSTSDKTFIVSGTAGC